MLTFRLVSTALVPAQGHLTHMPAHLFLRVGWYKAAVTASARTVANNGRYHAACLNPYGYGHNTRMLVTNARFAGASSCVCSLALTARFSSLAYYSDSLAMF